MLTVHVVQVNHTKAVWLVNKVNNKIKVWVRTQTKVDFPDSQCWRDVIFTDESIYYPAKYAGLLSQQ